MIKDDWKEWDFRLAKWLQDTANSDIAALIDMGLQQRGEASGRSTHHEIT